MSEEEETTKLHLRWTIEEVAKMFRASVATVNRRIKDGLDRSDTGDEGADRNRMRKFFMSVEEMSDEDKQQAKFQEDLKEAVDGARKHFAFDNPMDVLDDMVVPTPFITDGWEKRHRDDYACNRAMWLDVAFSLAKVVRKDGSVYGPEEATRLLHENGLLKCITFLRKVKPDTVHQAQFSTASYKENHAPNPTR